MSYYALGRGSWLTPTREPASIRSTARTMLMVIGSFANSWLSILPRPLRLLLSVQLSANSARLGRFPSSTCRNNCKPPWTRGWRASATVPSTRSRYVSRWSIQRPRRYATRPKESVGCLGSREMQKCPQSLCENGLAQMEVQRQRRRWGYDKQCYGWKGTESSSSQVPLSSVRE